MVVNSCIFKINMDQRISLPRLNSILQTFTKIIACKHPKNINIGDPTFHILICTKEDNEYNKLIHSIFDEHLITYRSLY